MAKSPSHALEPHLLNRRGLLTIAAFCGAASGTLITSMRKFAVVGSVSELLPLQPASSAADADAGGAGDVDVDVVVVARARDDRVRVRAAARLHRRDLHRHRDVADVEDANAAEAGRRGRGRRRRCSRSSRGSPRPT